MTSCINIEKICNNYKEMVGSEGLSVAAIVLSVIAIVFAVFH